MSCPDWRALVAHRWARDAEPPPEWAAALAHLEECDGCRRAALALDPSLVFSRLAGAGFDRSERSERSVHDEAREIAAGVRTLVRAREAERTLGRSSRPAARRAGLAAAALALGAALFLTTHASRHAGAPAAPARGPFVAGAPALDEVAPPSAEAASPALVDALDRPQARIYQLGQDDLSVVMIVDESLDV